MLGTCCWLLVGAIDQEPETKNQKQVMPDKLLHISVDSLVCIGIIGVLTRRNAIIIFMCIELMLNAVNLLLVAFSKMHHLANAAKRCDCRNRRATIRFLYYGRGCCGSKCGPGNHCHDVQEYTFSGCKFFEQVETLEDYDHLRMSIK